MDRPIVYTQEQGRSVDFLFAQRATMIGLAKLSQATFGSNSVVRGLAVTPNSPAALNVLVGIGEIYTMAAVDATTWGSLPADTTDTILKQGLNMAAQTISTPAPSTSGYSINYLIEAQYQDQDTNPAVLPFYNSSNPQIPLNGQGGSGAPLPTERQGTCVIQAKAGIAATTGTQTTPAVDSGWTALAVVTVANGQSTVTSGNISVPAGVPQITSLLQMMQTGSTGYAVDTSTTVNTITLALTPPITAYTDGQEITFKAANSNTGPCTINAGPGSVNFVGAAGAFQGGEIIAGRQYTGIYSASLNEVVLSNQTAGALQINPATASEHAAQASQILISPQGQLYYNSGNLAFVPCRGNYVFIPGQGIAKIPAGGIGYSPSGLTSNTLFYVYVTLIGGSLGFNLSTTGHTTDPTGVEVMIGDNTKVLVGMAYALSATSLESTVRSWANDPGVGIVKSNPSAASTTQSIVGNVTTAFQIPFLAWANEIATVGGNVNVSTSATNTNIVSAPVVDSTILSAGASTTPSAANNSNAQSMSVPFPVAADGRHVASIWGASGSGSATATWGAGSISTLSIPPRK
ncbi:hypothetical protein [Trinickia sp.]|uniref:hypothetical protein n=1 Tax=Trinickia sp. TaxID=2571163 RepID=UPI003F7D5343